MAEQLTRKDVERIESEIEHRKLVVRPACLEAVKEARAQGDLSENFEYYAAKREKNKNESRIRYLEKVLRYAHILEDDSADDEIGLENTVTVQFEDDGSTEVYRIVTPWAQKRGQSRGAIAGWQQLFFVCFGSREDRR